MASQLITINENETTREEDFVPVCLETEQPYTNSNLPVQMEDVGVSAPLPDELKTNNHTKRRRRRQGKKYLPWIYLLLATGLILACSLLYIGLWRSNQNNNNSNAASTANDHPSWPMNHNDSPPKPGRKHSAVHVTLFLLQNRVSSSETLTTIHSPQYLATQWMADDDQANLALPTSRDDEHYYHYIFRYVMAVNYFAMGRVGDTTSDNNNNNDTIAVGDQWLYDLNWFSRKHVCFWNGHIVAGHGFRKTGVLCDNDEGWPTELRLFSVASGTIPTENGLLTSLQVLDLSANMLHGSIPKELCHLRVSFLRLDDNQLTGHLPDCFSHNTNLKWLYVADNLLQGEVPSDLGAIPNLERLALEENQLTGHPLPVFQNLTNLEWIYADRNQFEGQIDHHPSYFKHHHRLKVLDLSSNKFTVDPNVGLPTHLLELRSLEFLDLSSNDFQGHMFGPSVENDKLKYLSVHDNQLNGGVPSSLQKLVNLEHFDVSNNSFHGPIHKEIGNLSKLQYLFLSNNGFYPSRIPTTFAQLTDLRDLSLRNTNRTGSLPTLFGDMPNLMFLDLGGNNLFGSISGDYGNYDSLQYLLLNQNDLTGPLPTELSRLVNLKALYLDGNAQLEGDGEFLCPALDLLEVFYTDCAHDVACSCCDCCTNGTGCSAPLLANVESSWEPSTRSFYQSSDSVAP